MKKADRKKLLIVVILLAVIGGGAYLFTLSPLDLAGSSSSDISTFRTISYTDGEDVSDFVEISIWVPDPDDTISETENIYTMSNFDEDVKSKDAEDVEIDISGYDYVWVEIDPDAGSVFSRTFFLITGGVNRDFTLHVYHLASDVNFNILSVTNMDEWDKATDGNFSLSLDFPHYTTANKHAGVNWDIDADEFDELTENQLQELYNEQNYRSEAPLYIPGDDTEKDFADDLEKVTEAFAFQFTMNTTISKTDGNVRQVNMTILNDNDAIELVISGEYIYFIFVEIIEAPYALNFEIQMAANITFSTVKSGRIAVPQDEDNLGSFTALSTLQS